MFDHARALQFRDGIVRKHKLVTSNYILDELFNVGVYKGRAFFIGGAMRKQRNQDISSVDALVAVLKRLNIFEDRYHLESEEFFDKFSKGQLEDSANFIEWSNDYQHYMAIRLEIESQIRNVA